MIQDLSLGTRIALGTFIVTLLILFAGIISANVRAQTLIEQNSNSINECQESVIIIGNEVIDIKIGLVTVQTHYDHIKESLDKIEARLELTK